MTTKRCPRCATEKPLEDFSRSRRAGMKSGRQSWCKVCMVERAREWRHENREKTRAHQTRYKYGLTPEQTAFLDVMPCAICGVADASDIDHDHATGLVRGSLCRSCNLGLGKFQDDPERLRAAARYLESPPFQNAKDLPEPAEADNSEGEAEMNQGAVLLQFPSSE